MDLVTNYWVKMLVLKMFIVSDVCIIDAILYCRLSSLRLVCHVKVVLELLRGFLPKWKVNAFFAVLFLDV